MTFDFTPAQVTMLQAAMAYYMNKEFPSSGGRLAHGERKAWQALGMETWRRLQASGWANQRPGYRGEQEKATQAMPD